MAAFHVISQLAARQQIEGSIPPPPGVTPNFTNPATNAPRLYAASIACLTLSGVFVAARLISKIFISHTHGWDDVTSCIALAHSAALSAICTVAIDRYGLGHHLWDVPATVLTSFLKNSYAEAIVYTLAIYWAKLSFLILYIYVFGVNVGFRYATYGVIALWTAWTTAATCLCIFECIPIHKAWDPLVPGHCIDLIELSLATGYMNIVTDVMVLLLPVPLVWQLQLATRLKFAVIGVFFTGALACVASIIRQIEVVHTLHNPDATWHNSNSSLWLVIEVNIGIICGCMPTLRPLLSKILPVIATSSYDRGPAKTHSSYFKGRKSGTSRNGATGSSSDNPILSQNMDPRLMDASYIELGPPRNHRVEIMARTKKEQRKMNGSAGAEGAGDLEKGWGGIVKGEGVGEGKRSGADNVGGAVGGTDTLGLGGIMKHQTFGTETVRDGYDD